ncbi:glycosyltransferase family 4 protein [Vibrio cincinnatiensis]|uniref:glycosyltransferase family 4 protein n=1 Tax=Vibrio cincinnatiensis TaxID=675 RepID=UPI001EDF4D44|nr:glycosyltransferase family 4 protein [Vibrio cincinnatiensis]MCG3760576.1 glycosyltransferase family 4 protein [Vibrio cincinnatiensis]MCG3763047.1 glycosyltransferase family 4 protein [Vibrio cincinnatiensis]
MRVLIFSNEFPPRGGGAGIVAEQFAEKLNSRGVNVEVLTSCFPGRSYNYAYPVIEKKLIKKLWFLSYKKFNFDEYDIILLNDTISILVAGMFFSRERLSKTICMLHGSEPEYLLESVDIYKKILNVKYFFKKAIVQSFVTLAHSHYMKEKIISFDYFSELSSNVKPFYFGYDDEVFHLKHDKSFDYRKIFNLPCESRILLTVSRVDKGKGFDDMLDIFEELTKKDNSYYWFIVGNGDYEEYFGNKIKDKNLEDKVFLLGRRQKLELAELYRGADIFLLLSNYKESFGLVYMEAQACGLPTIGRNAFGVREAIDHGVSGYLVDSNFNVLSILLDHEYEKLKLENILKFTTQFAVSVRAEELMVILKNV